MTSSSSSTALAALAGATTATAVLLVTQYVLHRRCAAAKPSKLPLKLTAEELIATRRSVFSEDYDPSHPVPRELLLKMLESANWAPTHGRTEPWRFVVFSSLAARQRLGEFEAELYKKNMPPTKFLQKKYEKKIKSKQLASFVIAICMKRQKSGKITLLDEQCAVACAVQNMHLTAASYGIGAYWSSGPQFATDEANEFFGLEKDDQCLGLFYVAYPKAGAEVLKGARRPIAEKVTWIEQ